MHPQKQILGAAIGMVIILAGCADRAASTAGNLDAILKQHPDAENYGALQTLKGSIGPTGRPNTRGEARQEWEAQQDRRSDLRYRNGTDRLTLSTPKQVQRVPRGMPDTVTEHPYGNPPLDGWLQPGWMTTDQVRFSR